ncbi:MAG: LysM peptidoglycan-binding domain-containing protein [Anaerolineae bacterium]
MKRVNLRMGLLLALLFLFVAIIGLTLAPSASAQTVTVVPYVVQPGDTLAKIASKYCTTWQEVYNMNAGVIGPDPNVLVAGTLLYVPNRCATSAPPPTTCSSGVYDHGPSMYANGTVSGNVYTVAAGDTWYSIGVRFGLPWETISAANGGGGVYPGRQLIIPGLCTASSAPPAQKSYLTISNPQPGAMLPNTFTVSGTGGGLPEGNVVVKALDGAGRVLAQKSTTLQGSNVGTGGSGAWSVSMTVNVYDITPGAIEASSPGVNAGAGVSITYSGAGSSSGGGGTVVYSPGQCTITGAPGGPMYAYPGGPQVSYFVAGGPVQALQRTVYNGMDWYMIQPEASMGNPPMWVPVSSLAAVGSGCS